MPVTKFIHAADIHLDSPLANLKRIDEATALRLQQATRNSLEKVIEHAYEHDVAAIVIAGDLFDGPVKDASAGLWVESLFKEVVRSGKEIFLIRGNHDSLSNACRVSDWPEGVRQFGSDKSETFVSESAGLAFHGQSFGARAEVNDLAANYPAAKMGMFNVGLLHTSLSSPGTHDTYAPTSLQTLENAGYDYWALGHIHVRSEKSLSDKCFIGYSGNTQGRHIREPGPKGCNLVTLKDGKIEDVKFLATDSIRWEEVLLDITELEHLRDIEDLLAGRATELIDRAEGRPMAVRIRLVGSTTLHGELTRAAAVDHLSDTLGRRLREIGDIWIETIKVASEPFLQQSVTDVLQPIKYLSRVADHCRSDKHSREELQEVLEELLKKARRDLMEYGLPIANSEAIDEEIQSYISRAEDMLVARLVGGDR